MLLYFLYCLISIESFSIINEESIKLWHKQKEFYRKKKFSKNITPNLKLTEKTKSPKDKGKFLFELLGGKKGAKLWALGTAKSKGIYSLSELEKLPRKGFYIGPEKSKKQNLKDTICQKMSLMSHTDPFVSKALSYFIEKTPDGDQVFWRPSRYKVATNETEKVYNKIEDYRELIQFYNALEEPIYFFLVRGTKINSYELNTLLKFPLLLKNIYFVVGELKEN